MPRGNGRRKTKKAGSGSSGAARVPPGGYEQHQIESLLLSKETKLEAGVGLFLSPQTIFFQCIYEASVSPAMRANGLNQTQAVRVFGSESQLSEVWRWLQSAQVIVVDLSATNPDVMYVLGLAHGIRRCPLIITQDPWGLPFNLSALRWIKYEQGPEGMRQLREDLTRAIRVHLAAARAKGNL